MDLNRLVTLALKGEEEARSELLERAAHLVYARVFRVVKNHSAAEDMAQDALVAALIALPRLRIPKAFLPWLRRITDNVIADHFAKLQRSPVGIHGDLDVAAAPEGRPDRTLEMAEERKSVRAALNTLPPRSRLALELFYFHDLTSREVADFLRISDDAARATLSRSRKELKRSITTMTSTKNAAESRIRFSVKEGSDTFPGPVFEHDSDTAKLYSALYPSGGSDEAASTGLSSERIQEELDLLQGVRLIRRQEDRWLCTMPVVNETDREIIRLWAEPIAEVVIGRLDSLQPEVAALAERVDGDLPKSTVMTFGMIEAAGRPFESLRAQMKSSAPDRGKFGKFCTAVFMCEMPGQDTLSGGLSCGHSVDDTREVYTYYFDSKQTSRARIERFNQKFSSTQERGPDILDALKYIGPETLRNGFTPELRKKMTDMLEIAEDRYDEFWAGLTELHVVAERKGRMEVIVPTLPLAPWKEYLSLLGEIGEEVVEKVADAADDLRKRVLRCSFADCYFADSVTVFFTCLNGMVKQAIAERTQPDFPKEADFSWGALLVA